jgi:hypothetical protein
MREDVSVYKRGIKEVWLFMKLFMKGLWNYKDTFDLLGLGLFLIIPITPNTIQLNMFFLLN